jgi:phage-related protein
MAFGFLLLDGTTRAIPDKSLSKTTTPKIKESLFGDGYSQRLADGLNSLEQTFSISFQNRPVEEIDDISTFLDTMKGATSFDFTYPDSNGTGGETTVKVICKTHSTTYANDNFYNLTATFNRVYEV